MRKTKTSGHLKKILVSTNLTSANGRSQLSGIISYLERRRCWNLMIAPPDQDLAMIIAQSDAEGFIIGSPTSDKVCEKLSATNRPTVLIDIQQNRLADRTQNLACVSNDNSAIGICAARYFLSLGNFRALGYVPSKPRSGWSDERWDSFRQTLLAAGKPVMTFKGSTEHELTEWLVSLPKPAAILASHDFRAVEVIATARSAKLAIPDQLSVLGVDDDELLCMATNPPLSSIRLDCERKGVDAAREMDRLTKKTSQAKTRKITCPVKAVTERESTRTPHPTAALIQRAMELIQNEATDGITPNDIAARLGVSKRLLYLRFQETGNDSIAHLIMKRKLEVFHAMLKISCARTPTLAAKCGFANVNSLRNLYRRTYGQTIGETRDSLSEKPRRTARTD